MKRLVAVVVVAMAALSGCSFIQPKEPYDSVSVIPDPNVPAPGIYAGRADE